MTAIMRSTAHKPDLTRRICRYRQIHLWKGVLQMEEKTYKVMNGAGAMNIVLGIIALAVGVATGVLLIISGAKLLAGKAKILF